MRVCHFIHLLVLVVMAGVLVGCSASDQAPPEKLPTLTFGDARGARGDKTSASVDASNLPDDVKSLTWIINLGEGIEGAPVLTLGPAVPPYGRASVAAGDGGAWVCTVEAPEGKVISKGTVGSLAFKLPGRISERTPYIISSARGDRASGEGFGVVSEPGTWAVSLFNNPVTLFALMSGVVAGIFLLAQWKAMDKFFRYFPPLIWMYFVPMTLTTLGITPDTSPLYSPFMSRYILPAILVLLLIPSDVRSIMQLGPRALAMMLIATTGIVAGALGSFGLITTLAPDALPKDTWKGVAALSGSWIGGSPNMFAVFESVGTPPGIVGPLVVVDTVVAYSWLGFLIALSAYQKRVDHHHKADSRVIDEISVRLEKEQEANARSPRTADVAMMIGVAFVVSQVCIYFGTPIFTFFTKTLKMDFLADVINAYGWGILLITAVGLALSATKVRQLDFCGASSLGNTGLYLMLTCYGAQANLQAVLEVPMFFALGILWLAIHVVFLYVGMRLLKAPLFLASTSSMANIGGTASAPVVAAAYSPSMAPVGLLMAILGSILGTPVALFIVATACRAIAGG